MQDGAETAEDDGRLERIRTVTQTARATWFGYLGALAFTGVTLLGVEDADFFARESATELPLIGISVPVSYFFGAGALLVTVIFVYLHVFLEQLWHALSRAPARVKGEPLAAHAHPWLVTEMALNTRRFLRGAEGADEAGSPLYCVETSPLGRLGVLASGLLLYAAGPALLAGLWVRSMPAHDAWMTGAIGVLLGISLWAAWASLGALGDKLREPAEAPAPRSRAPVGPALARHLVKAVGLVALVSMSVMRTEWDWRDYRARPGGTEYVDGELVKVTEDTWTRFRRWFRPVPADLAELRLTALPVDWLSRDDAERAFYADWCARPDTADCQQTIPQDGPFQQEWQARRETYLDAQPKPALAGRDLSFADLSRAFLPGLDLRGAILKRADLAEAQMEGGDLRKARMQGADLRRARMQGADLRRARMEGVDLFSARMEGARLEYANLQGAKLSNAQLQGADLNLAQMEGADLREAQMQGVDLGGARMEGADLRRSLLTGEVDKPTVLNSTNLSAVTNRGGALRFADLSFAETDRRTDFRNSFGDGSVTLPPGMARPCQWVGAVLDEAAFMAHWRGWYQALPGREIPWQIIAPEGYAAVEPVPPPEGCAWKTGPLPTGP